MNGKQLKAWRTGAGLTLDQASEALDVNRRTLIRAEGEPEAEVSARLAGKVAKAQGGQVEAPKTKPEPKAVLAQAEAKAAHLAGPKPSARQLAFREATKGVPVGRPRPAYGSMLKGKG